MRKDIERHDRPKNGVSVAGVPTHSGGIELKMKRRRTVTTLYSGLHINSAATQIVSILGLLGELLDTSALLFQRFLATTVRLEYIEHHLSY